jgi:hypothetical protein
MSQQTTFAPSLAKSLAVARPIPLLAPVMMATLPFSLPKPGRSISCSSFKIISAMNFAPSDPHSLSYSLKKVQPISLELARIVD